MKFLLFNSHLTAGKTLRRMFQRLELCLVKNQPGGLLSVVPVDCLHVLLTLASSVDLEPPSSGISARVGPTNDSRH